MLKGFLAFSLVFLLINPSVNAGSINNIIIFGDSLSDGGNRPSAEFILNSPDDIQPGDNLREAFSTNLYVPVSNPVVPKGKSLLNRLINQSGKEWGSLHSLTKKILDNNSLAVNEKTIEQIMPPLAGVERQYGSASWPSYLSQYLHVLTDKKGVALLANPWIMPSRYFSMLDDFFAKDFSWQPVISINYSWSSSISAKGCYDTQYELMDNACDITAVNDHVEAYKELRGQELPSGQSYKQYDFSLTFPGMLSQVEDFIQQRRLGVVEVDEKTIYFFYSGGNDLIKAKNQLFPDLNDVSVSDLKRLSAFYLQDESLTKSSNVLGVGDKARQIFSALNNLFVKVADNHFEAFNRLDKEAKARHIFFINSLDVNQTPFGAAQDQKTQILANYIVRLQNVINKARIRSYNWMSYLKNRKVKLHYVDIHSWLNQAINADLLRSKVACQIEERDDAGNFIYNQAEASRDNCDGYLFWNDVHYSSQGHEYIALRLAQMVQQVVD